MFWFNLGPLGPLGPLQDLEVTNAKAKTKVGEPPGKSSQIGRELMRRDFPFVARYSDIPTGFHFLNVKYPQTTGIWERIEGIERKREKKER